MQCKCQSGFQSTDINQILIQSWSALRAHRRIPLHWHHNSRPTRSPHYLPPYRPSDRIALIPCIVVAVDKAKGEKETGKLFEMLTAYGFGICVVSMILKISGISVDMAGALGYDLISKIDPSLQNDVTRNPATLVWKIGENLGGIVGTCTDILATFTVLILVTEFVFASSKEIASTDGSMYYPLMIVAWSTFIQILSFLMLKQFSFVNETENYHYVQYSMKWPLNLFAIFCALGPLFATLWCMPADFTPMDKGAKQVGKWKVFWVIILGLAYQFILSYVNDVFVSRNFDPVKLTARSCRNSATTNILKSFALGHFSSLIPTILLLVCMSISYWACYLTGIVVFSFGVGLNSLLLIVGKAIWPVCHNAVSIMRMQTNDAAGLNKTLTLEMGIFISAEVYRTMEVQLGIMTGLATFIVVLLKSGVETLDAVKYTTIIGFLGGVLLHFILTSSYMQSVAQSQISMVCNALPFVD